MIKLIAVNLIFMYFMFLICQEVKGSELMVQGVFSPCDSDSDCEHFPHGKCVDSFCECNGTRFCSDESQTKVTKLGERCHVEADCNIEHSVCEKGECRCESGRVGSEDGRSCLKLADGLGSDCDQSVQCYTKVPKAGCHQNKCTCQQKTHEFNGTCFNDTDLGQNCSTLGDCTHIQYSQCIQMKCTCKPGYIPNSLSNKCLEIASKIHSPCHENIQCSTRFGRAICQQGFCKCEELYQFHKQKDTCVRDILLDETCEAHTDCHGHEEGETRLECILGVCKCKSEFIEVQGFCTSGADRLIYIPSFFVLILMVANLNCNSWSYVVYPMAMFSLFAYFSIKVARKYCWGLDNAMDNSEVNNHEE